MFVRTYLRTYLRTYVGSTYVDTYLSKLYVYSIYSGCERKYKIKKIIISYDVSLLSQALNNFVNIFLILASLKSIAITPTTVSSVGCIPDSLKI